MSVTTRTTSPAASAADTDRSPQVGRSLLRREDARLLRGQGQYIADFVLPGMLHVAFVRSPVAHARIVSVNLQRAAAAPGVHFVISGLELAPAPAGLGQGAPCRRSGGSGGGG